MRKGWMLGAFLGLVCMSFGAHDTPGCFQGHFLFKNLPPSARTYCINAMKNRSMVPEEIVIQQGFDLICGLIIL